MKNFTKTLIIIFVTLISYGTSAQTFGVKGGLNLANILAKDEDGTVSEGYSAKLGLHLGVFAELPVTDMLVFEPGLFFSDKGFKIDEELFGYNLKVKANLNYVDIPLNLKAYFDVADNIKVYGALGPYLGVGISGKYKSTVSVGGTDETDEEDVEWGNDEDEDELKRFDFGLTFGTGVEFNGILVGLSYDVGLANISTYQEFDTKIKNRVFKLSVGYKFGG